MRCRYYIVLLSCFFSVQVMAQAIDNTVSFRNIMSDHYIRINYENDFFTASDRDYTQGIYAEWVNPVLKNNPFAKLLWCPSMSQRKYGIAIEDNGYTPNQIDKPDIQYGDRPYAGVLLLKSFLTAINTRRRERVSTQLSTGIIGPAAGGEGMQRAIHHWIHYTQPQGWHNQISNDIVINYQLNYEREFFSRENISFSMHSSIRAGTLSDKLAAGITIMAGNFYSPFKNSGYPVPIKKIQWYIYDQPLVNVVGYDATLQGGVFNHTSPYTIAAKDINRLTFQHRYGIVLVFKKLYLEYYQTGITEEFKTSIFHRTGGLQVGFGF